MPDPCSEHDQYVSKVGWLVTTGREDHIDEIADQFERAVTDHPEPSTARSELRRAS